MCDLNKKKILNMTPQHMTEPADRPFSLSRLHSSGQRLKTQAGLQKTHIAKEKGRLEIISHCLRLLKASSMH